MNIPVAIRKNPRVTSFYTVTWVLTNKCQNQCSYCPKDLHNGKRDLYTLEHAMRFLDRLIERHESLHFSFAGGEPTIAEHFQPILDRIRQSGNTAGITSNGRRPVQFWKTVAPELEYVCVSYHPESRYSDDDLLAALAVIGERTHLAVRVMMVPELWQRCLGFIEKFKHSGIAGNLETVRILDDFGSGRLIRPIHYTSEQEAYLLDSKPFCNFNPKFSPRLPTGADAIFADGRIERLFDSNAWVSRGQTNFEGWTCNIGLETLFVNFNGDIYRGNCSVGGRIGSILNPDIQWPVKPIRCNERLCHCTTDVQVSKFKSRETEGKMRRLVSMIRNSRW